MSKLSLSSTSDDVTSEKEEEMHELYQQFNREYVNAILEACLTRHDCTSSFHSYVLYVFYTIWAQIHTSFHSFMKIGQIFHNKYTFTRENELRKRIPVPHVRARAA